MYRALLAIVGLFLFIFMTEEKKWLGLRPYQLEAINKLHNGSILCGGVGSGKSLTSLGYYYKEQGGNLLAENYVEMQTPRDLYIITTAHKRDLHEWEKEMLPFMLSPDPSSNLYSNKVVIDSWNNIKKYQNVYNAFFIFDEQRVTGSGVWVKSFLKITKKNRWILLSATPGDTWSDYIPVFVANGFYKNKTDFSNQHIIYARFVNYPKIDRYVGTKRLEFLREQILVDMIFERQTQQHHETIYTDYDIMHYKFLFKERWNYEENKPIKNAAELCYLLRKVVNSDDSRAEKVELIAKTHPRIIIFYNYTYELEILRSLKYPYGTVIAEWNGEKHEKLPTSDKWVYLVQYLAGNEGWNCTTTDTMIFYSQSYSYKIMVQAAGRIDRMNTPFTDLYYFHLKSRANIDLAITRALTSKKEFNERKFTGDFQVRTAPPLEMPNREKNTR